jgi:rare lipoprotein A (peptidoglycan hydrolase)
MKKVFTFILFCLFMNLTFAIHHIKAIDKPNIAIASPVKKSLKKRIFDFMRGYASYYGGADGFDGRQMANGDIFDSNNIHIAAHPTLPLGTKLKVIDLSNLRTLYVEVTDRMPKYTGRVIDLTRNGAIYLGMHRKGVQRVKLVKITDDEFAQATSDTDNI